MNTLRYFTVMWTLLLVKCNCYKILVILPSNGHSHHILFASLIEELALRNHDVTAINYYTLKKIPNLRQISLETENNPNSNINMTFMLKDIPESIFVDFYRAYDMAIAFKEMADDNCKRLMTNEQMKRILDSEQKYDLVIAEQFVTDCGLAIAYKLQSPVVGMTAHVMMPWTYSRLGAPNNPSFVPNHFFGTGSKPGLINKIKSAIINIAMNAYYTYEIRKSNQKIVNAVYSSIPDLEHLGNNVSLILLNQYFSLTGSRLHGANIIEVGGMHIRNDIQIEDKELKSFLDNAAEGAIYISFGTVAKHFPSHLLNEIESFIDSNDNMMFVWKVDNDTVNFNRKNLITRKWLPQPAVLCHPNVKAFISHFGMLSTTEAIHCGVPIIGVPLFGDQFSNAALAVENGLGITLDIYNLNRNLLNEALSTVLQDRYQKRSKELSQIWKDRPLSAMETAVFWVEYVARHQGRVDMTPPSATLNIFEYLLLDVVLVLGVTSVVTTFCLILIVRCLLNMCKRKPKTIRNNQRDKKMK